MVSWCVLFVTHTMIPLISNRGFRCDDKRQLLRRILITIAANSLRIINPLDDRLIDAVTVLRICGDGAKLQGGSDGREL